MPKPQPSARLRVALFAYSVAWVLLFPLIIAYLAYRGLKDRAYISRMPERFGFYKSATKNAVWIHAVSLGEMRSAGPLINRLLADGESIVTTHFTPAGRKAAYDLYPDAITAGQLTPVYVPFEFQWCYRRFFKRFKPKYGLVMEIEIWPMMITASARNRIPLFMCNAQYPAKSFARDKNGLRGELTSLFAGHMAKSQTQADRFEQLGCHNIAITGELRFEQPIPPHLLAAAARLDIDRPVLTTASAVEGEDEIYLSIYKSIHARAAQNQLPTPLFIHVPRAPERFAEAAAIMGSQNLTTRSRSDIFDKTLTKSKGAKLNEFDILIGDSMGEMYFFLALADAVIVGGGFHPKGAHNIIEPLALQKPTFVGPQQWTIEYPAVEALDAGVLISTDTPTELANLLYDQLYNQTQPNSFTKKSKAFNAAHAGASEKTLAALPLMLQKGGYEP